MVNSGWLKYTTEQWHNVQIQEISYWKTELTAHDIEPIIAVGKSTTDKEELTCVSTLFLLLVRIEPFRFYRYTVPFSLFLRAGAVDVTREKKYSTTLACSELCGLVRWLTSRTHERLTTLSATSLGARRAQNATVAEISTRALQCLPLYLAEEGSQTAFHATSSYKSCKRGLSLFGCTSAQTWCHRVWKLESILRPALNAFCVRFHGSNA